MGKIKTHKGTVKRFKITKGKKVLKKPCGQDHFNARESGNVTRKKRKNTAMSASFTKTVKQLMQVN